MRRLLLIALLGPLLSLGQSEAKNYVTKDTVIVWNYNQWGGKHTFQIRITRHTDSLKYPTVFMLPGKGEQGTSPANNQVYGPHYWMNHGWDGGVSLGNGMHYPNWITLLQESQTDFDPAGLAYITALLIKTYNVNPAAVYMTGLSMGGWTPLKMITLSDSNMKMVKAIASLSGADASRPPGYPGFGHWARTYGGRFFGTQGYADERNEALVEKAVNDSLKGAGYFAYVTVASGSHGGWNSIYDPNQHNWTTRKPYGPLITGGTDTLSQGNYTPGSSLFQWLLRQGDTSIVGPAPIVNPPPVVVNKAPLPAIAPVPADTNRWVVLDGSGSYDPDGTIDSTMFNLVVGPSPARIISSGLTAGVVGLIPGTYIFKLTVWDDKGTSSSALVTVVVNSPPVKAILQKTLTVNSDGTYSLQ